MRAEDGKLGAVGIMWRGGEAERRSATLETSRFKAVATALANVGVDARAVVYEDDVADAVRYELLALDGVLVFVNPIHEGRNRARLDTLLREVAGQGVWVSAHPDVMLKMGTKEVLYRTREMRWGLGCGHVSDARGHAYRVAGKASCQRSRYQAQSRQWRAGRVEGRGAA